jgi:rhomboid protease GluP
MSTESQPAQPTTVAETGYAPTQPPQRRRREYSEWDPRSAPGTYFLLALNVAVFVWMVMHHVSWTSPTIPQLEHYGANNAFDVLARGQWYRLVTAIFVHIGIIHIASNMWCLWNLGLLGEPLVGPFGLIAVYVLTGVAGNMLRITWDVSVAHFLRQPLEFTSVMGAGASGAVFGIAGILIVLLSNHRLPIPWRELKRLRKSVIQFAVINLVIGLGTVFGGIVRVDNFAHIGGFVAGLALGPGLISAMTLGRARYLGRQKIVFGAAAFVLSLYGYWIANFR